jgi:hypothetical protein
MYESIYPSMSSLNIHPSICPFHVLPSIHTHSVQDSQESEKNELRNVKKQLNDIAAEVAMIQKV